MAEDLAHEDTGSGAHAVLLAHPFPFDRRIWRRQIDELSGRGARVIAPDLRGFGASADLPKAGSIDEHADDLARLLDRLGIERAIVVGMSMGGYVALALARRHPTRLSGLLLADTKAGPDSPAAKTGRDVAAERARREGVAALFDSLASKLVSPSAARVLVEELRALAAAQSASGVVAALEAMRDRPDSTPSLGAIRAPTRVVVGAHDTLTPRSEAEVLARGIPGASLVEIASAGHLAHVERPEPFLEVLLGLVAEVARS